MQEAFLNLQHTLRTADMLTYDIDRVSVSVLVFLEAAQLAGWPIELCSRFTYRTFGGILDII